MKLKEKLADDHSNNVGYASGHRDSFLAGFDAAKGMYLKEVLDAEFVGIMKILKELGEEEV